MKVKYKLSNIDCMLAAFFVLLNSTSLQAISDDQHRIAVQEILDLKHDGVNVITYSSASRELFVSHPATNKELNQWNIADKKLLHTYSCPQGHIRWDNAVVSPDGKLLIVSTYPQNGTYEFNHSLRKAIVFFIDTQTHQIRYTAEYEQLVRTIKFDQSGKFIWIETTYPGYDKFVYDHDGNKYSEFNPKDFEAKTKDRLWDVPQSKGGPPAGLFYMDDNSIVHKLIDNPLNQHYALTKDGKYIGSSTLDERVRIWRVFDLKEIFNEKIGEHPVMLLYDSEENQFLVLDGIDGNTQLRTIKLPVENGF